MRSLFRSTTGTNHPDAKRHEEAVALPIEDRTIRMDLSGARIECRAVVQVLPP